MFSVHDRIVKLVVYLDFAILTITLLFLILVVLFRLRLNRRERRREKFMQLWQPILLDSISGVRKRMPPIQPSDTMHFLLLWNHMQESLLGNSRNSLNNIARTVKINSVARQLLLRGNLSQRLLAINTLGHLREWNSWKELESLVRLNDNSMVALTAARALARMDPVTTAALFVPLLVSKPEWPSSQIAVVLKEIGPDPLSDYLRDVIFQAPEPTIPRLTRYLQFASPKPALAIVQSLLQKHTNTEIISSCLNIMVKFSSKQHRELVRSYAYNASWVVRLQVVSVLGKIGIQDDIVLLLELLKDREWWVRYRTACAISNLPFVTLDYLEKLKSEQSDAYARDALRQVIVEKRLFA